MNNCINIANTEYLISVIIPVYKVQEHLNRCIESIVGQTHNNLEIILVDDGSPDNCPKMCDEWAKKDKRIKILHIENSGVANARNIGIKIATGDYIAFVDSDDYIELNLYEILLSLAIDYNADITLCDFQINEEDDNKSNFRKVSKLDALKLIAIGDYKYGVIWNKLYKRQIIGEIKMPPLICCEDLVFNYYVFKESAVIVETDHKLYHYMQNKESVTNKELNIGSFDAVHSKEIILAEEHGTDLEKYAVRGLISSCFVGLSRIILSGKFIEKYNYLKNYVLKYKKEIYSSDLYSPSDKLKTFILLLSPKIYNKLIKIKNTRCYII